MKSTPRYLCLPRAGYQRGAYQLETLREADIIAIMHWRNAQREVLRQNHLITRAMQLAYYQNQVRPTFSQHQPSQILLSYLLDKHCIGYGGLTNIDWHARRAEVSFLVADQRARDRNSYRADFGVFLQLLQEIAFADLQLNRLFTETFAGRTFHISLLEQAGFVEEGRLREHARVGSAWVSSIMHGVLSRDWRAATRQ